MDKNNQISFVQFLAKITELGHVKNVLFDIFI